MASLSILALPVTAKATTLLARTIIFPARFLNKRKKCEKGKGKGRGKRKKNTRDGDKNCARASPIVPHSRDREFFIGIVIECFLLLLLLWFWLYLWEFHRCWKRFKERREKDPSRKKGREGIKETREEPSGVAKRWTLSKL
jgi:hypothetical protein